MEQKNVQQESDYPSLLPSGNDGAGSSKASGSILSRLQDDSPKKSNKGNGGSWVAGLLAIALVTTLGALVWLNAEDLERLWASYEPDLRTEVNNNTANKQPAASVNQTARPAPPAPKPASDQANSFQTNDEREITSVASDPEPSQGAAIITGPQPNPLDALRDTPESTAGAEQSQQAKTRAEPKPATPKQSEPEVLAAQPAKPSSPPEPAPPAEPEPQPAPVQPPPPEPTVAQTRPAPAPAAQPSPRRQPAPLPQTAEGGPAQDEADVELLEALVEHLNKRPAQR